MGGEDVLDTLENLPRKDGTERPAKPVNITEVVMYVLELPQLPSLTLHSYQDPFEEYKVRLAKKLAKKTEAQNSANNQPAMTEKKPGDGINWFGVKLGTESAIGTARGGSGSGGVGRYLDLKRPAEAAATSVEHPKKRKLGFGEFENF